MGQVYRARDTKLDRDVALQVLAEHVAADPISSKRVQSEATGLRPHVIDGRRGWV